jgi:hypothetical protein
MVDSNVAKGRRPAFFETSLVDLRRRPADGMLPAPGVAAGVRNARRGF